MGERPLVFDELFGFSESRAAVDKYLTIHGDELLSDANGEAFGLGDFSVESLASLRQQFHTIKFPCEAIKISAVVGDARELHSRPENQNALFQVASQFNLLEMVNPDRTPEQGVSIYENDRTQGPACALAALAGTVYRNYFIQLAGQTGQSANNQVNTVDKLERQLKEKIGLEGDRLWSMSNGYVLIDSEMLGEIHTFLTRASEEQWDQLRSLVQIGLHWGVEVTDIRLDSGRTERVQVSQAYCSAMPLSYNPYPAALWAPIATLILEATYEASLISAVLNKYQFGSAKVLLTLVGGGVFGNPSSWILSALERAIRITQGYGLDIKIVCYGAVGVEVAEFISRMKRIGLCA